MIAGGDREHCGVCANSYYIWLVGGQYACKYWNIAFNKITYASLYNLEEGIPSKTLLEQLLVKIPKIDSTPRSLRELVNCGRRY